MAYDNRDSGCGVVAVAVLALLLGLAGLVLVGLFYFRSAAAFDQATMTRKVAEAAARQAAAEAEFTQDHRLVQDVTMPAFNVTITLDAEDTISVDDVQVDLDGLRSKLKDGASNQVILIVDDQCRFERVATVLSAFDEVGVQRPEFAVPAE